MADSNYVDDFKQLEEVLSLAQEAAEKPEIYLEPSESKCEELKKALKSLYNVAFKRRVVKSSKSQVLPELIIDGFDDEQIWQQIESLNEEYFSCSNLENLGKVINRKYDMDDECDDAEDYDSGKSEQSNSDDETNFLNDDSEDQDDNNDDEEMNDTQVTNKMKKKRRKTEVDDKFFKLDELDEYLKKEDRKELNVKNKKEDSSDEESIDFFNNLPDSDDQDDENDEDENKMKYADFFDAPDSDGLMSTEEIDENKEGYGDNAYDESFNEEPGMVSQKKSLKDDKQVRFNILNSSEGSGDSENDTKEKDTESTQSKSSLKLREERLKKKIEELEAKAISEKPWNQKGEVDASSRPSNSALEEILDFTSVTRPAPVMTEKTSMKLEDIIKTRIKDKAWDDVEKKFKPVETPMEYKKKLILNQEKSKESLAQIYENEYLQKREALNSGDKDEQEKEEPSEHIEIKKSVLSLFRKLDALSNYHYTPKLAKPEIKIVSNLPAINMEEVAPVTTSDATLLAPEEIKSKQKGELIGRSERTKTDMKRERRKKKLKQHNRALNESKKLTEDVRQKKSMKNKIAPKKLTGRNIINADETNVKDGKSLKSSTAFFAQLQDQVESSIKTKTKSTMNSKKNKNKVSAVKLKL